MRSTGWPPSLMRCALSGLVACALHVALACALAMMPSAIDAESRQALVWLEAAPLAAGAMPLAAGAMPGSAAMKAQNAQVHLPPAARAAQAQARLVRRLPKLVSQTGSLSDAPGSQAAVAAAVPTSDFVAAVAAPAVHAQGALGKALSDQANAPGLESGASAADAGAMAGRGAMGAIGAIGEGRSALRDAARAGGLVHGPVLRAARGGCTGYFPADARSGHGEVEIDVNVDAGGHARASSVLNEQPFGQGFGSAARGCVRTLEFAPAVDRSGAAVAGHAKLRLRFDRPSAT